jgi:tetratricopeptide (TPR) repeat protein
MNAIWLYVPPVILLAALITLAIMLGKKTAAIKKIEALRPKESSGIMLDNSSNKGEKLKKLGHSFLRILETSLYYIKIAFRKSEEALTQWLRKIKESRTGRKEKDFANKEEKVLETPDLVESDLAFFSENKQADKRRDILKENILASPEVIVRKKPEIPPAVLRDEPVPEDKAVEDALIHRIAENPKDMEAYRELGDYYMSIGNIKDAKESFKMVLRLRPRDLKAKTSLKEIELKMRLGN